MKRPLEAPGQAMSPASLPGSIPLAGRALRRAVALLFVLAAALPAGVVAHRAEAAGPSMFVSPAAATAGNNTDINLDIDAADITLPGLGGYVIALQWNPAILTLTSLADSGWVMSGSIIVACTPPTIDNTLGHAELDCTPIYGFGPGVTTTAPEALAHATFHSLNYGATVLGLTGSSLLDPNDVALPGTTITNGSVSVVMAAGGIAAEPNLAGLPSRSGARNDELLFGAGAGVMATAAAAGWWLARRLRQGAKSVK